MRTAAEPELAVGIRLFWATVVTIILVVVLPLFVGRALQSPAHLVPETMARPTVVTDRLSTPTVDATQELPKAQPPPPELPRTAAE
jgi:hypothetical protein